MTLLVLTIALALYAASAAAYGLHFARPHLASAATAGWLLLAAGFVVHGVGIGVGCVESDGFHLLNLRGGFGLVGWIGAGACLVLLRASRLPAAGAFVLPLVLAAVLPAVLSGGAMESGLTAEVVRLPALKVHVTAALGGVALFAIAAGIAAMFLLQERELKGKRFGALFSRLPPLHVLDRISARFVGAGFAAFTVAVVAGSLLARSAWGALWEWDGQQIASVAVWAMFALVIALRRAGVSGRKHARLTVIGFAAVMLVTIGLRQVPCATRHQGEFDGRTAACVAVSAER